MNCMAFKAWLDAGRPAADRPVATAHPTDCATCAEELAAARALDQVLAQRFATAPASFVDDVVSRLPDRPVAVSPAPSLPAPPELPWWAQVLLEPSAADNSIEESEARFVTSTGFWNSAVRRQVTGCSHSLVSV